MKLTLTTHGGLVAGLNRSSLVIDTGLLSDDLQKDCAQMVSEVAENQAESVASKRFRDALTYVIVVEDDNGSRKFRQTELCLTDSFAKLLSWIEANSHDDESL